MAVTVHSHSHKRSGQTVQTTIPECSSSYLPSDLNTDAGDGQQSLVHSHSRSDNMSDVGPRCIKGEEAETLSRWGISLTVHKLLTENQLLQKLYYRLTYIMIKCLCSGKTMFKFNFSTDCCFFSVVLGMAGQGNGCHSLENVGFIFTFIYFVKTLIMVMILPKSILIIRAWKCVFRQIALFFFWHLNVATELNEGGLWGHIPLQHLRTNSVMQISDIMYGRLFF